MSDEKLRDVEIAFKMEPTDDHARAWVMGRRRWGGESDVMGFKLLKFMKMGGSQSSWKLAMQDLFEEPEPCEACKGAKRRQRSTGRTEDCWVCNGIGFEPEECLQLFVVNKVFDHFRGRYLIGRFRRTPTGLLRWIGP